MAMANAASRLLPSLLLLLLLALSGSWVPTACAGKHHKLKPSLKHEKFLELNFFVHDDLLVSNASAFFVVPPLAGIPKEFSWEGKAFFGGVVVIDDALTEGPDPASKQIGQAKGFYVWDGLVGGPTLEFVFTAVFNDDSGFAPGTTLSYRGHDDLPAEVREIAIVGGTGDLRLARGWAQFSVTKAVGFTAVLNFTSSVFYGGYRW